MNKKILMAGAVAGTMALAFAAQKNNDPVVMTVGGIDVPRSEFEYLYNKNSQQQVGDQSIDEYAGMFSLYKMKVAAALEAGIDTTEAFRNEFRGYRSELAAPYLTDSASIKKFMLEDYDRAAEEVEAIHIMLFKNRDYRFNRQLPVRLDSIRDVIENKGGDFADLAARFSQDRGSASKGGNMGFIRAASFPYEFETAAWTLAPGAMKIVESPQGYHLVMGGKHRPASGNILAQHILILVPQDATDAQKASLKAKADSLYNVAVSGADFDQLATKYSEDPGSASKGGHLDWFGTGVMVKEFEQAAFDLPVGGISTPVQTRYGWHIIKKLDAKGRPTFEEMKPQLLQAVTTQSDVRSQMIYNNFIDHLAKKYNFKDYPEVEKRLKDYAAANGVDSLFFDKFLYTPSNASQVICTLADKKYTVGDFCKTILRYNNTTNPEAAGNFIGNRLDGWKKGKLYQQEDSQLEAEHPDFRNLVNEYRDGMLLFEISNRNVWDKAAQDTEGLEKYYAAHRGEYSWKAPRAKGYMVQAENDSVADAIRAAVKDLPVKDGVELIRKDFAKTAKVDHFLVEKGDNPYIDNLMFDAPAVDNSKARYKVYYLYEGKIIDAPEEMNDVRGMVTSDYQNVLEEAWIKELKAKYPVKVNKKELKKIRKVNK